MESGKDRAISRNITRDAALALIGCDKAHLLSQKQRDTLWRIAFKLDDITAADGMTVNTIRSKIMGEVAA